MVAAVLTAAAELFAQRGPAAVSIKDVAERSGVNHGLVFRHFGTKENLVGAVLDDQSLRLAEMLRADGSSPERDAAIDRAWRVTARALLDGYSVAELQTAFPNITRLIEDLQGSRDRVDAQLTAAHAVALELGWRLFGPFISTATGLTHVSESTIRESIDAEIARIVAPNPGCRQPEP